MNNKCPKENCPNFIPEGRWAISRRDNKTPICPDCGVDEAIEDFIDSRRTTINEGEN
jgi:hypothetical protein